EDCLTLDSNCATTDLKCLPVGDGGTNVICCAAVCAPSTGTTGLCDNAGNCTGRSQGESCSADAFCGGISEVNCSTGGSTSGICCDAFGSAGNSFTATQECCEARCPGTSNQGVCTPSGADTSCALHPLTTPGCCTGLSPGDVCDRDNQCTAGLIC